MEKFKDAGKRFGRLLTRKSYWQQAVTKREKCNCVAIAIGITGVTAWIFYHSYLAIALMSPLGIWIYRHLEEDRQEQKKNQFLLQFKEMTESVASALSVGYSAENAFKEAQKDMKNIYNRNTILQSELDIIVRKIRLQIPLEQILYDFAERVEIPDVKNFATVFTAAKRSGGDMISIIQNTASQIGEKIDVKREIDVVLAAKKYEFRIMCVIPYGMMLYMQMAFPDFMGSLYGNVVGIGVMTACLFVYGIACMLGVRLIKIEV